MDSEMTLHFLFHSYLPSLCSPFLSSFLPPFERNRITLNLACFNKTISNFFLMDLGFQNRTASYVSPVISPNHLAATVPGYQWWGLTRDCQHPWNSNTANQQASKGFLNHAEDSFITHKAENPHRREAVLALLFIGQVELIKNVRICGLHNHGLLVFNIRKGFT